MTRTEAVMILILCTRYMWLEYRLGKRVGLEGAIFGAACWVLMFCACAGFALGVFVLLGGRFQ